MSNKIAATSHSLAMSLDTKSHYATVDFLRAATNNQNVDLHSAT